MSKTRAVFSAILTFALFVVLPIIIPDLLPLEIVNELSQTNFDLEGLLNEIAMLGVVMTIITFVTGLFDKASVMHLIISSISKVYWLFFTFTVMGLGDFKSLGITSFSVDMGVGTNTVVFDFSIFAYLAIASVLLKIIHSALEFMDARKSRVRETIEINRLSTAEIVEEVKLRS